MNKRPGKIHLPQNTEPATDEFTAYCSSYYQLTMLLAEREERLKNLLDNAPVYCGQTVLSEVDAIISYYREAQTAKEQMDKTFDDMKKTERNILMIMRHFDIPPGTMLTGEIPGELEFEIWADGNDTLYIIKTNDIEPEPDDPNVIVIKFSGASDDVDYD